MSLADALLADLEDDDDEEENDLLNNEANEANCNNSNGNFLSPNDIRKGKKRIFLKD